MNVCSSLTTSLVMDGCEVDVMTWRYKKNRNFESEEFFQEWEEELFGLKELKQKGIITGDDTEFDAFNRTELVN